MQFLNNSGRKIHIKNCYQEEDYILGIVQEFILYKFLNNIENFPYGIIMPIGIYII